MVFRHGSKGTSFNQQSLLLNDEQKQIFLNEINMDDKGLLEKAFLNHARVGHFSGGDSGLNPFAILSVHLYIQRGSPSMLDAFEQTNTLFE